jgi:hypothetical protein
VDHRRQSDTSGSVAADSAVPVEPAAHITDDSGIPQIKGVRASDIEPYTGLRYLSKLFRFMAVILVLLLVAEVIIGIYQQGGAAVPTLLGEASRLIVFAGVLWGTGDLAHLLIDVGHDVRAARILVTRAATGDRSKLPREMHLSDRQLESASHTPRAGYADRGPDRT